MAVAVNTWTLYIAFMIAANLDLAVSSFPSPEDVKSKWTPLLSKKMTEFAEKQIGSLQLQQVYENDVSYVTKLIDGHAELTRITSDVEGILKNVTSVLTADRDAISKSYEEGSTTSSGAKCCGDGTRNEKYNDRFKTDVDLGELCDELLGGRSQLNRQANDALKNNLPVSKAVTWQYFGDYEGNYHQYPSNVGRFCDKDGQYEDHRFKKWYVNTASPKKKNIVIVIDESGSMAQPVDFTRLDSQPRMHFVKTAAKTVIDTLNPKDWAGVVAFSNDARSPEGCFGDKVAQANPQNKKILKDFVSDIKPRTSTLYSAGFKKAFRILSSARMVKPDQFKDSIDIILFLTDGQPTDVTKEKILDEVYSGQRRMRHSVHLLVYAFGREVFTNKDSFEFIHKLGDQNNGKLKVKGIPVSKWEISAVTFRKNRPVGPVGKVTTISDDDANDLKTKMGSYYLSFPMAKETDTPSITTPFLDPHQGLVTTMGLPTMADLGFGPEFTGVTAVDVVMEEVFQSVTYYKLGMYSYAILVGSDGNVLIHPSFPKPREHVKDPLFMTLKRMEPSLSDDAVTDIADGKEGMEKTTVNVPIARGKDTFDGAVNLKMDATYYYKPVAGFESEYTVILVLVDADRQQNTPVLRNSTSSRRNPGEYHRLDLKLNQKNESKNICLNSKTKGLALGSHSTIKFSPLAFLKPENYMEKVEQIDDVKAVEKYLKAISSPGIGLKNSVRPDVHLTSVMDKHWQKAKESIWRYVGTESGLFRVYPGMVADNAYCPTEQAWYKRSIGRPDIYTFSRPSISSFGGDTEVVSISRVFNQKRTSKSTVKPVAGVTGADVSERYFQSLIYTSIPQCLENGVKCYLLDDSGYVMETSHIDNGEVIHEHLTEKFPWLAFVLIEKGQYLKPTWCNKFSEHLSQLFYDTSDFNFTSNDNGATPCRQFRLSVVPETNVFLLVIRDPTTCHLGSVDTGECKCSKVCQECHLFASTKCQCPCACAFGFDNCANQYDKVLTDNICPLPPKQTSPVTLKTPPVGVQTCEIPCVAKSNQSDCEASGQCTWCQHMEYENFPVCTDVCPTGQVIDVSAFFPCADFTLLSATEQQELLTSFHSKVVQLLPNVSQDAIEFPHNVTKDTLTFTLHELAKGPSLNDSLDVLKQATKWRSKFMIGPNKQPAMYRSSGRQDFTNLKISLKLPGINFNEMLTNSLTMREDLLKQLQTMVKRFFSPEVASSLANMWLHKDIIPFTLKKPSVESPVFLLKSISRLQKEIQAGKLMFSIEGSMVAVSEFDYVGSFHEICPLDCDTSFDEDKCDNIPGCDFGNYDNTSTCSNNSLLAERREISAYFPCAKFLEDLGVTEQRELTDNFRHKIRAILPSVSEKAIHSFKISQGGSFVGSKISFVLQGTMLDSPLVESLAKINGTFRWESGFTVGSNKNMEAYRSEEEGRAPDDFTHLQIKLMVKDTSLNQMLIEHPLEGRQQIVDSVKEIANLVLTPTKASTVSDVWIKDTYVPFTISKSMDDDSDLLLEFQKLKEKVDRNEVSIRVGTEEIMVTSIQYEGSFDNICPRKCEDGVTMSNCSSIPGCDWSDLDEEPECTDNALLAERLPIKVYFPCADFTKLDAHQKDQVLESLEFKIYAMFPNISRKAFHSWAFDKNTADTISFILQGTMQSTSIGTLSKTVMAAFDWEQTFTVGTTTHANKYRSRSMMDYTDLKLNLIYDGSDFDNVLAETPEEPRRGEIMSAVELRLRDILPHEIFVTVDNFLLEKDSISFTVHKDVDSNYRMLDVVETLGTALKNGKLDFVSKNNYAATAMDYFGSFQEHCPLSCEEGLNQTLCNNIVGCSWNRYGNPAVCSNDSSLVERKELQVFFPCLSSESLLNSDLLELERNFRDSVLTISPNLTRRNLHSITIGQDGFIRFTVQASVLSPPISDVLHDLSSAFTWDSVFTVGPKSNPLKYRARDHKDYTNVRLQLNFEDIDFIGFLKKNPLTGRSELEQQIHSIGANTFSDGVWQTIGDIWIGQDYIPLSVSKPADSPINLMEEATKLTRKVNAGKVHITIEGVDRTPSSIDVNGTFYELCPSGCQTSSEEQSCHLLAGCDWCMVDSKPHCDMNCTLPERLLMSSFFPCMQHVQADEVGDILRTFRQRLQKSIPEVTQHTLDSVAMNESSITFELESSMGGTQLGNLHSQVIELFKWQGDFKVGPSTNPLQYRARHPSDYTSVKVKSVFKDRDFDAELVDSPDLRQSLDNKLQQLVQDKLNTGLSYGNFWIQENYVSFVISKPIGSRVDLLKEVEKLWAAPSEYIGTTVSEVKGGFLDLCPSQCSSRTSSPSCDKEHGCQWCYLDQVPYCGTGCLLQERVSNLSLVLPCMTSDLSPQIQGQITGNLAEELAELGSLDAKAVHNITMHGNTINLELAGVLGKSPIGQSSSALGNLLKKRVFKTGPDSNPSEYSVLVEDDFTEAKIMFQYGAHVDLEDLASNDMNLRDVVSQKIQDIVTSYFPADISETLSDIQLTKNIVSFVIEHPKSSPGSIDTDASSFISDHQDVLLPLSQSPVVPTSLTYELSYGINCGLNCSTSTTEETCGSQRGCSWCRLDNIPVCGDNCYLPESIKMTGYIPCNETADLTDLQRQETVADFRRKLLVKMIGHVTEKSLVSAELTEDGVVFELQSTMQTPINTKINEKLRELFSTESSFTIGPKDRHDMLTVRNMDDYTDLTMALTFDYDFSEMLSKDVTSRRDLLIKLKSSLNVTLGAQLSGSIALDRIEQDVLIISLHKEDDDHTYLQDMVNEIQQLVKSGQLQVTLSSDKVVTCQDATLVKGHFYSLCPTSAPPTTTILMTTTPTQPTRTVPPVVIVKGETGKTVSPIVSTQPTTESITTTPTAPESTTSQEKMCNSTIIYIKEPPIIRTQTIIIYNMSDLTNETMKNITSQSNITICGVTTETCSLCATPLPATCAPTKKTPVVLSEKKDNIRPVDPGTHESLGGDPDEKTGLSTEEKTGIGIGVPLGILAALSALALLAFFWRKKKPKKPVLRPRSVAPIEPFNPNIYHASIGDDLSHEFANKGAELERFRDPNAVYGRLSNSPAFDGYRPGSGRSIRSTTSWDSNGSYTRPMMTRHN